MIFEFLRHLINKPRYCGSSLISRSIIIFFIIYNLIIHRFIRHISESISHDSIMDTLELTHQFFNSELPLDVHIEILVYNGRDEGEVLIFKDLFN